MIAKNQVMGFLIFSLFFMSLSSVAQAQQKSCRRTFTKGVKKNSSNYEETQSLAQSAEIKTQEEHKADSKSLEQPSTPNTSSVGRWQDIVKLFEGTRRTWTTKFPSYEEAQSLVQSAGIKTWAEYNTNYKNMGLPSRPDKNYKDNWQGFRHFLGTEGRTWTTKFPSYEEAQSLVQSEGIKTVREYQANYKNMGLPSRPDRVYKDNWQGFRHFLGTGRTRTKEFPSYEKAQIIVQSAGIKMQKEYKANYKNLGLPSHPDRVYKDNWQGLRHFLGTEGTATKEFPSYEEAQNLVQSAGIKMVKEYQANYKSLGLPSAPHQIYKDNWQGMGHFLGTGRTRTKEFPSYEKAQIIVQSEGIKMQKEYKVNYKRLGLPSTPDISYKKDWQGLGHFLGTGRTRTKEFPSYEEAQIIVQSVEIKTMAEYNANYKRLGLPSNPNKIYKASWQGLGHFLRTGRTRTKK